MECSARVVAVVDTKDRLGKVDGRYPHWVAPYNRGVAGGKWGGQMWGRREGGKKGAGWDGRYGRKKGEVREGKRKGKASNDFR